MSKFQIVLLSVFGVFIFIAVLTFALYRGNSGGGAGGANVTVWGSFSAQDFNLVLNNSALAQDKDTKISYIEKPEATLERDFVEALAEGGGPDLILLSQDHLWSNKSKLTPIPYASISERDFKETFVEAGEVYLMPEGIYALPLVVDPLVLYYNRDLLSAAGKAKPLAYWDEIYAETTNLTKRDAAGNLVESTIALGETRNIKNAKDIFAMLLFQAGSSITGIANSDLTSLLNETFRMPVAPTESALEFYTQFSNPTKAFYSWNRTLPEAQARFTSGDLAYYLGYASEYRALRNKNPTLNFSVALVPQSRVSGKSVTSGKLYSLSLSRGSKNPQGALTAAGKLIATEVANEFTKVVFLPPVRRDLLSRKPTDSIWPVFYNAALQTRTWLDPNPDGSAKVFSDMIEAVTSGRARVSEAVLKADGELEALIK